MILSALILGAALLAGIGIVAAFWNDIIGWLKRAIAKVSEVVQGVIYGTRVFIKKISEGIREISRHYSKVDNHWQETVVTRTISEDQVPPEILAKANGTREADISQDLELQLEHAG